MTDASDPAQPAQPAQLTAFGAAAAAAAAKRDPLRDWKVYLVVGGPFMVLVLLLWAVNVRLAPVTGDKPGRTHWLIENFGQFGDAMAPITAIASVASFFVVFVALKLQTTELRLQRRELRLQRRALKLQHAEMVDQREELEAQTKQMTRTAWQQRRAAAALEGAAKAQIAAAGAQQLQAQTARRDAQRAVVLKVQADVADLVRFSEQSLTRWGALITEAGERDVMLLALPSSFQAANDHIRRFRQQALPDLRRIEAQALEWLSMIDDERRAKEDAELIDGAGAGGQPSAPWWWRVDLPAARTTLAEAHHMFNMLTDACRHLDESQLRALAARQERSEAHNEKMLEANARTAEAMTRAAKLQEMAAVAQQRSADAQVRLAEHQDVVAAAEQERIVSQRRIREHEALEELRLQLIVFRAEAEVRAEKWSLALRGVQFNKLALAGMTESAFATLNDVRSLLDQLQGPFLSYVEDLARWSRYVLDEQPDQGNVRPFTPDQVLAIRAELARARERDAILRVRIDQLETLNTPGGGAKESF